MARDVYRNRCNPRLISSCFYDESFLGYIKKYVPPAIRGQWYANAFGSGTSFFWGSSFTKAGRPESQVTSRSRKKISSSNRIPDRHTAGICEADVGWWIFHDTKSMYTTPLFFPQTSKLTRVIYMVYLWCFVLPSSFRKVFLSGFQKNMVYTQLVPHKKFAASISPTWIYVVFSKPQTWLWPPIF